MFENHDNRLRRLELSERDVHPAFHKELKHVPVANALRGEVSTTEEVVCCLLHGKQIIAAAKPIAEGRGQTEDEAFEACLAKFDPATLELPTAEMKTEIEMLRARNAEMEARLAALAPPVKGKKEPPGD